MAKYFKKNLNIILLFILAFIFKIYLCQFGNTNNGDIIVHLDWSQTLFKYGFSDYYFRSVWATTPPTQPSLINVLFYLSQALYDKKYILSQLHNLIKIPPTFFILWFDTFGQYITLKLWPIIADILSGALIYKSVKKYKNSHTAFIASAFFLFNPITIFESSIWGQNDTLAALLATYSFVILKNQYILSPLLFAFSLLLKPTTVVFIPIYILIYIKSHPSLKKIVPSFVISLTVSLLTFLPFIQSKASFLPSVFNIFKYKISPASKGISRASVSAFNFYSTFFTIDKTPGFQKLFLTFTIDHLSILMLIFFNLIILKHIYKTKLLYKNLFIYLFLIAQTTFVFTSSMLERYFLSGIIASSVVLWTTKNKKIKLLIIIQYIIHFLNLFYVFNFRFIHIIRLIFQSNNFLLVRLLSLINVLITIILINNLLKHERKPAKL